MSKGKTFFYLCLAFIFGIAVASFSVGLENLTYAVRHFDYFLIYVAVIGCLTVLVLGWRSPKVRLLALGGIFLFLGVFRYQISLPVADENKIQFYNGEKITFQGIVAEEPDERLDHVKLKIKVEGVMDSRWSLPRTAIRGGNDRGGSGNDRGGGEQKSDLVSGNVLVRAGLYPEYQYGDELRITCKLRQPEPFQGFDYDKYLARWDIYSLCSYPEITLLNKNQGNVAMAQLLKIKHHFQETISQIVPEPQASLLNGILLGLKRGLQSELYDAFRRTGTAHIIVVSGMHIAIIAQLLTIFFLGLSLGRRRSYWLSVFIILTFIMVIGFPASAVRGAILGILLLTAEYLGRLRKIANALAFTAFLMLLINPKVLRFDLGFQLSFLATLGIVYIKPLLDGCISNFVARIFSLKNPPESPFVKGGTKGGFLKTIKDLFTTTLGAIILTSPLILYTFGQLSLIAPLANILILPIIPFIMSLGFAAGIAGMSWLALGKIIGWGIWLVLGYVVFVIQTLANLKFASLEIGQIHWTILVLIYLAIGVWWWVFSKSNPKFQI